MKLGFRILWIDDDWLNEETKIRLKQEKDAILQSLEADYFEGILELNPWTLDTSEPFPYDSEHYDLFIVDFNIWDKNGLDYIKWIRESCKYADIIFYSKDSIQEKILNYLKGWNDFLEWVFIANRDELGMKFEDLLKLIDRKVNNLYSMRGLVLAETAELDYILSEIIEKILNTTPWLTFSSSWSLPLLDYLVQKTSNLDKIEWLTNSNNPNKMPQSVLNLQQNLLSYRRFYKDERNPLAHSRTVINSNNQLSAGNITYSIQDLKDMRKKLLERKNDFQQLRNNLP